MERQIMIDGHSRITKHNRKRVDFEIIRIIAILFVMINHSSTYSFVIEDLHKNSIEFFVLLFLSSVSRVAVPLFFMVSGALLLKKEEAIRVVLKKRVLKYLVIIIVFSVIQYFLMMYWGNTEYKVASVWDFLSRIYVKQIIIPYWFLYSYLALMIMLPFLRKLVKSMNNRDFEYLIIIHLLLFGVLFVLEYFIGIGRINLSIPFACEIPIFFFIIGYYFDNVFENKKRTPIFLLICCIIAIIILTFMAFWGLYRSNDYKDLDNYHYNSSLIVFPTVFIFLTAKKCSGFFINKNRITNLIVWVGGTTFGIYLLEGVFERAVADVYFLSKKFVIPLVSWLGFVFCAFVLGSMAVSVYKLIVVFAKKLKSCLLKKDKA